MERLRSWLRPLAYLGRNPISLAGAAITTAAGITLVGFVGVEVIGGGPTHPYAGIFFFLLLPAIFVVGLLLIPAGALLRRRALRLRGELPASFPKLDLGDPLLRRAVVLVSLATLINVGILGFSTYAGVEYMDSVQFCGTSCHTVMQPEYTAYLGSPHSRVACVQCHIGPGASWFVRSKLDGVRQVVATGFATYSRPIPSPVHELRPARETCEQCHWPRKFTGDQLRIKVTYADDEANTRLVTVLLMRIGGHTGPGAVGIHGRHLDDRERIRYVADDDRRQQISRVLYLDDDGRTVEYVSPATATDAAAPRRSEERRMDCVDCHNRPTHAFELPQRAIDRLIEAGRISSELPFAKKKAVELIQAAYPDRERAARTIVDSFLGYYRKEHPDLFAKRRASVEAAADATRDAYLRNVFPAMKVGWGTHPNNIGHQDSPGCFRCHDDQHTSKEGKVISQDCSACHAVLAMEESNPKVLSELGIQ